MPDSAHDVGFLRGAASAPHQIEGNNTNSDSAPCVHLRAASAHEGSTYVRPARHLSAEVPSPRHDSVGRVP